MAAHGNAEVSAQSFPPLKTPKTEVCEPSSPGLSDGNTALSNSSTPSRASPLDAGTGSSGVVGRHTASGSIQFPAACRGMSWTPAETNALIAVWGNERLAGAGTVFGNKPPGAAMYERVSRALFELGYERTPSQCRERIKTLRRCYSRVKEHGVGKRKSSYTFEQLEQVFGQGGWETQQCQPVLINSSGLYQAMESDCSTMEEYSQEDWGNHSQDMHGYQEGDTDTEETSFAKKKLQPRQESSEEIQKQEIMQNIIRILESLQLKWELFQSWTDFSRLHLSNKLAIFGIGYNTRWNEDIRYHYAEISSQVPLGKRLREYFNPEKTEGRVVMIRVQKMNWKNAYYKFLEITISEARCLELHMEVDWIPIAQSRAAGVNVVHYLLPGGIPKTPGLYAIGYEEPPEQQPEPEVQAPAKASLRQDCGVQVGHTSVKVEPEDPTERSPKIRYCYLGIAEDRTLHQCLFQHFQSSNKHSTEQEGVNGFLAGNCTLQPGTAPKSIYIKFIEVERDFLSAGSLVECLEKGIGYPLKFNK
uniref:Myb/SANT DNA binding domain containing 2 n=1 Tax=Latimeria chalumnae TaxID=7897 RepID=H3AJV1_LATCH|nr:PREDICTED: myb/SANT-like DNA-binding domain-containing protein 2 [Latimeria chalumnae]|eukprot:XP_005991197.1 PREDICTED: myb/SANT-like DNA-binding domain-containing protein 2 [Latimeria chalumnae]